MLRYVSIFINKCCKETLEELKKPEFKKIEIPKLMPAFMNIQEKDMKMALEYIIQCINKKNVKDKAVHNMAIFFHSKLNDARKIIEFLEEQEIKKSKGHQIYFEVDYALNICKQNEKKLMDELLPL